MKGCAAEELLRKKFADLVFCVQGVRKFFVPEQKLGWTTTVAYRAVFDASLVEGTPDLPDDSTHWVNFLLHQYLFSSLELF